MYLEKQENRIIYRNNHEIIYIEAYGRNSIRVRCSKNSKINEKLNWTLLDAENCENIKVEINSEMAFIENGKIKMEITESGIITFFKGEKVILRESHQDYRADKLLRSAREFNFLSGHIFESKFYFEANSKEQIFGMGQDPCNILNLKGASIDLCHKNSKISIPFYQSSLGYGFYWNNPAIGNATFATNHTCWYTEGSEQIDYIVIAGDTPDEINEKYVDLTGHIGKMPKWAQGFWQCKFRYKTQVEVLKVAREYKTRGIPISMIVIDFFHWTQQGEWKFLPENWPDPKAMVDELTEMGIKVMVSIWPTVDRRSENFEYMRCRGMLLSAEKGLDLIFSLSQGDETHFDATNPEAREFVANKIKENYMDYGIENFWLDEAEPELTKHDFDNIRLHEGSAVQVIGTYPFYYAKTFYDKQISEGKTDFVNLIRCAWHGSQRFNTLVWSGDTKSTFEELNAQIKAGLNISMCGIPWWTTDIGGFMHADGDSPEFRELLIRWFQYALYCPVLRLHGFRMNKSNEPSEPGVMCTGGDNEVWSFGDEVYEICKDLIDLRYEMQPYIDVAMTKASEKGTPPMRPLFYDFSTDEKCCFVDDEFMFGDDLLIAPIAEYKQRERSVYLPKGHTWREISTSKVHQGGSIINVDVPIEKIAVFVKDNAIFDFEKKI